MVTEPPATASPDKSPLLAGVYRLDTRLDERGSVERFAAHRVTARGAELPVIVLREPADPPDAAVPPRWPSIAWEADLRSRAALPGLAQAAGELEEENFRHLILDAGPGVTLWDAWDDPAYGAFEQYAWLAQLAELLDALHQLGVVLESLRPDQVLIDPFGRVVLDPTVVLLPLPLPAGAPVHPTLTTAPELADGQADIRCDLYCFGAVLYALQLGREITELDCRADGAPIPIAERLPDAHPFLVRLIGKTFCRDRASRFPTGSAGNDLGGFIELHRTIRQAQRLLGRARLDLAAWSSAGMVRGTNEDALAIVHASEAREDVTDDLALVIVADGIGGSAAGEVAARYTVAAARGALLRGPPFASLTEEPGGQPQDTRGDMRKRVVEALREANRLVYAAARESSGRHGMACTAEVVFLDGRHAVIGHVGDSRTYHFHRGKLTLLTSDHTFVHRLVQLGQLSPEEAETHPRRHELEQAVGGRSEVEPSVYTTTIVPGDWMLVCSDGLTARVKPADIQDILERAPSAELAARRLVNRANRDGVEDNVTVVVVRAS